jgi:hypothetical protein
MSKALTNIEVIADDVAADLGDSNSRYKFSILRKLLAGYRDMNLYIGQDFCVKTAVLEVDNVIQLPEDFVYETKVGIKHNGRIAVLSLNDDIQPKLLTQQETERQLCDIWNGNFWGNEYVFYNYYWNGGLGELYGWGGVYNCNGYYNIDRGKGEIYIGSLLPPDAEIVIEYQSSGQIDGLTLVPTEWWNALKYYALSEWYAGKNLNLAQYNRLAYEREYTKVKRLYSYRTALFIANSMAEHYRSSVH